MSNDHSRHDDDRTGDNDINYTADYIRACAEYDLADHEYRAVPINVHADHERLDAAYRAKLDAAAAVLGTDDTATDLDALRAAYIDTHALYWIGELTSTDVDDPADALCTALRTAPSNR